MGWLQDYQQQLQNQPVQSNLPVQSSFVNSNPVPTTQALTHSLLANLPNWNGVKASSSTNGKSPSNIQRILDILSRPLYASANVQKTLVDSLEKNHVPDINPFDYIAAGSRGLAGKDKTTSRDIFNSFGYKPTGIGGFASTLASDILLDPTTYIGPGLIKGVFKAIKGGSKAGEFGKAIENIIPTAASDTPVAGISHTIPPVSDAGVSATGPLNYAENATVGPLNYGSALPKNTDLTRNSLNLGMPFTPINPFEKVASNVDPKIFGKAMGNITGIVPDITKITPYATVNHTGDVVLTNIGKEQAGKLAQKLTLNRRNARPIIDRPVERLFYNIYNSSLGLAAPKSNFIHLPNQSIKDILGDTSSSINLRSTADKSLVSVTPNELHKYLIEGDGLANASQLEVKIGTQFHSLEQLRNDALKKGSSAEFKAANEAATKVHPEQFMLQHVQDLMNVRTNEVTDSLAKWRTGAKAAGVPANTIGKIEQSVQSFRDLGYSPESIRQLTPQLVDHYSPLSPLAQRLANAGEYGRQYARDTTPLARVGIQRPVIVKAAHIVEAAKAGDAGAVQVINDAALATKVSTVAHDVAPGGQSVIDVLANRFSNLVKAGKNKTFNPAKQVNAFRELERNLVTDAKLMPESFTTDVSHLATSKNPMIATIRKSIAMKHLVAFEDAMIAAGHSPVLWDGTPMRLSQLIEASGGIKTISGSTHLTDLFKNHAAIAKFAAEHPTVAQAIEESKAAHAIHQATTANEAAVSAVESASKVHDNPLTTIADAAHAESLAPKVAANVAANAGADSIGQKLASLQATNIIKTATAQKPFVAAVDNTNKLMAEEAISVGASHSKAAVGASRILTEAAHAEAGVKSSDIAVEISKAEDSKAIVGITGRFLSMFKPNFGKEDIHPFFLKHHSIAQSNPRIVESLLNQMSKRYTPAEFNAAFKVVQSGGAITASTTVEHAASEEIRSLLENVFTTSGIGNRTKNNTFVLREGIKFKYLNDALRRKGAGEFQFGEKVIDHSGAELKLTNPLDSWRYHNPKNPMEFIASLRNAADDVAMEKAIFDELGTVFGSKMAVVGKNFSIKHKYLNGTYFSKDTASQIQTLIKHMTELNKPVSENLRYYDIGLRLWKTSVTIYSPSHHVRNIIGDMYLAWGDGVFNPKYYRRSAHIIRLKKNYYSDVIGSENLVSRDASQVAASLARPVNPDLVVATLKNGTKLDGNMVYEAAYREGILPHSGVIEDTEFGNAATTGLPQPFGGQVARKVRALSESREHYPRIAHFLHALESESGTTAEVFQKAGMRVRKWHPDGSDLSIFEKRNMRRLFPFYSWSRKAIPLAVEMATRSPAKVTIVPKATFNLANAMGVDPQSLSQPFPVDKIFPNWIADLSTGPIVGDMLFGNQLDPVTSLGEQFANNPLKGVLNTLTPAAKIPMELGFGREALNNAPITDKTAYIDKQISFLNTFNRMFNTDLGAGSLQALATGDNANQLATKVQSGKDTAGSQTVPILNWLTGAGMIDTQSGSNLRSAQFDLKARNKALRQKNG